MCIRDSATPVSKPVACLVPFHGRLLVGAGRVLTMFELGKKRLLKKAENSKVVHNKISSIDTRGERVFVGDVQDGLHLVAFNTSQNQFLLVAGEANPRWIASSTLVDYNTVAGGDKFGNFFVSRLPPEAVGLSEDDPTAGSSREGQTLFDFKFLSECSFHVGTLVQWVSRASLGGLHESLVYGTLQGGIGAFAALGVQSDISFFEQLSLLLRDQDLSLVGRDHLSFRSTYAPSRHVIDGDLCDLFTTLPHDKQATIAKEMDRDIRDILRKLEDVRDRML